MYFWFAFQNMDIFIGSNHHPIVICDAHGLKKFWEKIIETYTKQKEDEDSRLHQSALNKWVILFALNSICLAKLYYRFQTG